jgi:hypothetical protein
LEKYAGLVEDQLDYLSEPIMSKETPKGGYRIKGQSPVKETKLPLVSVITVVYNGLNLIEKTIHSVVRQTYPNIEYIVIDGGSSDGTVEIIRLYETDICFWISEPDQGIYDAMNKGLATATGDYVWFMNAGDQIYSNDTLEKIFADSTLQPIKASVSGLCAKIFFGDTMIVNSDYREVGLRRLRPPEVLTWKSFKKGMLVCHQAIIVSRHIAEPFDPKYRHSADFDWVVRALKKAEGKGQKAKGKGQKAEIRMKKQESDTRGDLPLLASPGIQSGDSCFSHGQQIINTHLILCAFLDGGHSKQNISISLRERFHSMARHYGLVPTILRHIPIVVRFGWYYLRNKRF